MAGAPTVLDGSLAPSAELVPCIPDEPLALLDLFAFLVLDLGVDPDFCFICGSVALELPCAAVEVDWPLSMPDVLVWAMAKLEAVARMAAAMRDLCMMIS